MKPFEVRASSLPTLLVFVLMVTSAVVKGAGNESSGMDRFANPGASAAVAATHRDSAQASSARVIDVRHDEDLQAALDSAVPGDTVALEAGATFAGNFRLPNKKGSSWITIRSSAGDDALLSSDTRISPSFSTSLPKIVSSNSEPALRTEPGAHNYRLIGIEFTISPEVMLNYGIVRLGEGTEVDASLLPHDLVIDRCLIRGRATADVVRGISLNCAGADILNSHIGEIHGIGFDTQAIAGWNGPGPFRIINNYLEAAGENVMFGGADPKIQNLVPSDIQFRSNHCTKPLSWKDNILASPTAVTANGSAAPGALIAGATYYYQISARGRAGFSSIATSTASEEITVTLAQNQTSAEIVWNPVDWATEYRVYRTADAPNAENRRWAVDTTTSASMNDAGATSPAASAPPKAATRWSVKNLFELKNARRVAIDGNVFENNWVDAQSGFAVLLTVRNQDGSANWSVVEDVSFTNNIVRHTAAGINLLGRDDLHISEQVKQIKISGNLFDDVGDSRWGGNGRFLQITDTLNVRVDRNTVFQTGNIITAYGPPNQGFIFTNNIAPHNDFGIVGDGSSSGNLSIDRYFPGRVLKKNVIIGGQGSRYPKKNFFPALLFDVGFLDQTNGNYRLSPASPYKNAGTKDQDIGADIELLEQIAQRAVAGRP